MSHLLIDLFYVILDTIWDVLPIVLIIFGFQFVILRKPIPNLKKIITGFVLVLLGLGFFLEGLQAALFPLGKLMAQQLTDPSFIAGPEEKWTRHDSAPGARHLTHFCCKALFSEGKQ